MNELTLYLKNNQLFQTRIHDEVRDSGLKPFPKRTMFSHLCKNADDFLKERIGPRLIALSGLRGVGKTTLMWQVSEYIFNSHTENCFFINAEEINRMGFNLYQTLQVFEREILDKPFHEQKEPIVFLMDEVHDCENWDKDLKILYDKCKSAFILCTGSSALLLHKSADLATRWSLLPLFPLNFPEYLQIKNWLSHQNDESIDIEKTGTELREALFFSENMIILREKLEALKSNFQDYFVTTSRWFHPLDFNKLLADYISFYNIIRFLNIENKEMILDRIIELFERILLKDVPAFVSEKPDSQILFRLLLRLAVSDEVNFHSLARELRCKEADIELFINTLNKAEVLNVFFPYGGIKSKTGSNRKPFFMSPSLRCALSSRIYGSKLEDALQSKLYEDIVAMYLRRTLDAGVLSFGHSQSKNQDYVIETRDKPILLEVGKGSKTTSQFHQSNIDFRYGIIVSASASGVAFREDCVVLPLSWFLIL